MTLSRLEVELYDLARDKVVVHSGEKLCAERSSPCSTLKVALSLMAFDASGLDARGAGAARFSPSRRLDHPAHRTGTRDGPHRDRGRC